MLRRMPENSENCSPGKSRNILENKKLATLITLIFTSLQKDTSEESQQVNYLVYFND